MTYQDFYKVAKFMNECSNNFFTEQGVACNAYDYLMEYEKSVISDKLEEDMIALCHELYLNMGNEKKISVSDIYEIQKVFDEFLENY